jgi:hypothetical protein
MRTGHYKNVCSTTMTIFHFPIPFLQLVLCALAIAIGSDKQSKCCRTHRVIVIAMKSKGNNNKLVLKVVTTKTLQPPKRYHSADVCLPGVTRPRHNSFGSDDE